MALMDERKAFSRSDIAAWAGVVGVLALVSGGLVFILGGQVSIWVFGCAAIGAGGIGLWMWWAPGEFQAWMTGRQTRYGTTSILISILFVGLIAYAYVLVDRANITADLTSVQRYSLAGPTLDTIAQLRDRGYRVRIVGFFSHNKLREQEAADILMRQYEAKGQGVIEVAYIDPNEQPDLANKYGYQSGFDGQFMLTVLTADGQPRQNDVVTDSGQVVTRYVTILLGDANERDITTGLKTVASAGAFKIYFTVGHGERDLTQVDDTGISRLFVSLDGQGIAAEPLQLSDVARIPDDASAVLIVGAWQDFSDAEVQVLDEYVQRGGRLGIFADPPLVEAAVVGDTGNTFLQEGGPLNTYLWDEFGVRVRDALVIETKPELINGSEWIPIINTIAPHTIMSDQRDQPIYMKFVRPLELVSQPDDRQNQYVREPLLYTSEESFGETGLTQFLNSQVGYDPQSDIPGPLLVGVTVRRQLEFQQTQQPRLVIIGDSDLLKNEFVKQFPGNVFLWTDIVDWLTGFAQAVTFSPVSDPTLLDLVVSQRELHAIAWITMIVLPGVVLVAGTIVWWYRQR
jgi:ABC-2 type transport system permease protein